MLSGEVSKTKLRIISSYIGGVSVVMFSVVYGIFSLEMQAIDFRLVGSLFFGIVYFAYGERTRRRLKRGEIPAKLIKPSKGAAIVNYILGGSILSALVIATPLIVDRFSNTGFNPIWMLVIAFPMLTLSIVFLVYAERLRRGIKNSG